MPATSSFWLDETATVFVARHGPNDPSLADVAPQAWKSIYYPVAHASEVSFGFSELSYRIPSLLAMAGLLLFIGRLAARLIHPDAAWFAVFACLALRGINYHAADARPYALGMLVAAASLALLVRWLDTGRWIWGLCFVVVAALLWRVHLLYAPGYLVFAAYTLARKLERDTPVRWRHIALVSLGLAVALTPVFLDALALQREAKAHVFAPRPEWRQLAGALQLTLIAVCGGGAWLLQRWRKWPAAKPAPRSALVAIAAWWLLPVLVWFAYSRLTGNSIFVTRYLSLALPGVALAATAAVAFWVPSSHWRPLAAVLGAGALIFGGQWQQLWTRHHNSDWRAAARAVNEAAADPETPVICPNPYAEGNPPAWRPDYPLTGFLNSYLAVYPIRGRLVPFPRAQSAQIAAEPLGRSRAALMKSERFILYGWEPQVHFWRDWFAASPEFAGWRQRQIGGFADVSVCVFEARR